jgi:hypothetical protein
MAIRFSESSTRSGFHRTKWTWASCIAPFANSSLRLVVSRWELPDAGATRRDYEITDAGRAVLHDWAFVMQERARLVGEFLAQYEQLGLPTEQVGPTQEV